MQKSLLLAKSNIRKSIGQLAAIFILILVASLLLNIWLVLAVDYSKNFERRAEKLNSEDAAFVFFSQNEEYKNYISDVLNKDGRTDIYTMENCLAFDASSRYRNGEMATFYIGLPVERAFKRNLGQYRIVEESEIIPENAVWLPYLYKDGGNYLIGDDFSVMLFNKTYNLKVAGFYENMLTGSFNSGICTLLFDNEVYQRIEEENGQGILAVLTSVKLKNRLDSEKFIGQTIRAVMQKYPLINHSSTYFDFCRQSRTLTADICSSIVSGVAFLTVIIAVVVLVSNIANYIGENMRNLGVLKAVGYQSKQLVRFLLLQFTAVGFLGTMLGIILSYTFLPVLNKMLIVQTGIPYTVSFQPLPMLLTFFIVLVTIFAAVLLSTRKIKRIEPIIALRQGIQTHSFRKNYIPLDNTSLPLCIALSFKTAFTNVKQNIAMFITVTVLSLLTVFSSVMIQNFILDTSDFLGLVAGERADVAIGISGQGEQKFRKDMPEDKRVEKVYLYSTITVYNGENSIFCYVTESADDLNNPNMCYEGRLPIYANEVAIAGKYAEENDFKIGSVISLKRGG